MANFANYGSAGGWTIYVDNSRDLCFAERVDSAGFVTHMNVVSIEKGIASMAVYGTTPETHARLVDGENSRITILFDDGATFEGTLNEVDGLPDNYAGGVIHTDNPDFIDHVREKEEMLVNPGDDAVIISLKGTKAAMALGLECLAEHHGS